MVRNDGWVPSVGGEVALGEDKGVRKNLRFHSDIRFGGEIRKESIKFAVLFLKLQLLDPFHVLDGLLDLRAEVLLGLLVGLEVRLVGFAVDLSAVVLATLGELHAGSVLHHLVRLGVQSLHYLPVVGFAETAAVHSA